ncbi:hypothetical protein MATL_G00073670 [Megalops atlanticus]|uniref:Ig-like domain-containing protein n=1 Tax=Megalops atlanticus TaxID=7932 RepID=A0A9D3T8B5_MEGAT|nr:hypothetical protein MATL_G00073670 [Megalops atlanticus]
MCLFIKAVCLTALFFFVQEDRYCKAESSAYAELTADPPWSDMFVGETVALTCKVKGSDPYTDWEYSWKKVRGTEQTQLFAYTGEESSTYTLRNMQEFDSAEYHCEAKAENHTLTSSSYFLRVTALPRTTLTLQSEWTEVFITEKVTLSCEIQGRSTEWMYKWYRNGQQLPVQNPKATITFTSAKSDTGTYTCRGEYKRRRVYTDSSNAVTIKVSGTTPKPVLTQDPPSGEIFTGERVTLSCRVGTHSAGWKYLWYKDRQGAALPNTDHSSTDGSTYTISSAALFHSGRYWCRAWRGRETFYTQYSDSQTLRISALPHTTLTLQSEWTEVFITEKVTLSCEIQGRSTEWMYKWYRNGQQFLVQNPTVTVTITSAKSDTGTYTCRGEYKRRRVYTDSSNAVIIKVLGTTPKPVLTQDPPSGEIFTGDRVTLSCGVSTHPVGWKYLWYKDRQGAALPNTDHSSTDGSTYTISSAALFHSGRYWCQAGRGREPFYTKYSDSQKVNINARPQAVVILETGWIEIFRTDSLTLRCEVEGSSAEWNYTSADWNYTWYRDGQQLQQDSSGDRYTVMSGNGSYQSEYRCRGNRTGNPSYTEISKVFRVNNIVLKRRLLVSVAGCLAFGLAVITLGCIWLRRRRKSVTGERTKPQTDLFFSMAERNTEILFPKCEFPPEDEQPIETQDLTGPAAACKVELYSIVNLKNRTEVLSVEANPEELSSFKACS